jgi:hypothetical protein
VRERVRVCVCVAGQSRATVGTPRHRSSTPETANAQGPASDVSSQLASAAGYLSDSECRQHAVLGMAPATIHHQVRS